MVNQKKQFKKLTTLKDRYMEIIKFLIILCIFLFVFSSCGVIGFIKGTDVGKKEVATERKLMDLPVMVKEKVLSKYYSDNYAIHLLDSSKEQIISMKPVIRCYGPFCPLSNINHKTLLKVGLHFEYNGIKYYMKNQTASPLIIYQNKLYYTKTYSIYYVNDKLNVIFYEVDLSEI